MANDNGNSSASTSKSDSIDMSEAVNQLIQGKRHMIVQDFSSAVISLQKAAKSFAEKYGELANECGDAYFLYGKALLEVARLETGVLGNALDEGSGESEESGSEDGNKEGEAPDTSSENDTQGIDEEQDTEDSNDKDVTAKSQDEEQDKKADNYKGVTLKQSENDETQVDDDADNEDDKEAENEEEVSSLQLAWEVIELAKIIFERQSENNKAMKLRTADAYLKLGEIAIESGNYDNADEDLKKCLRIRQDELEPDDRLLAETHFQLGMSFALCSEFDKSRSSFEEATKIIKERILSLENNLAATENDKIWDVEIEIKDLKDLIPQIDSKIEDVEDMKRNAAKARQEALKELFARQKVMAGTEMASTSEDKTFSNTTGFTLSSSTTNNAFTATASPTKPVSNIGHLVRKKRKADDEVNETGSHSKRLCSS